MRPIKPNSLWKHKHFNDHILVLEVVSGRDGFEYNPRSEWKITVYVLSDAKTKVFDGRDFFRYDLVQDGDG